VSSKRSEYFSSFKIKDAEVEIDADLKLFSTMRLQAHGDVITLRSVESLQNTLKKLTLDQVPYRVIGWGANALLPEESDHIYLKLAFDFDKKKYLQAARESYHLPASVSLSVLSSHAVKFGLKGWEVFTGIPASLGGALYMNAGTNLGEISQVVEKVYIATSKGELITREIKDGDYSYRKNHYLKAGDVIYAADLKHLGVDPAVSVKIREYLALRNKTQPLKEFTCGCIFKNAEGFQRSCRAGHHIDIMGLKGSRVGDVEVSAKHANFMVNRDRATRLQVEGLMTLLQEEMKMSLGINFETEVEKF